MRKFSISTLALLAGFALAPFTANAQAVPPTVTGTIGIAANGISGLQSEGGLSLNGQTDMVGGAPMSEVGGGSVYTTDTASINPANLSVTTTGTTTGVQGSEITDPDIASGQTAYTSNDVFGESETYVGLNEAAPSLTSTPGKPVGWSN